MNTKKGDQDFFPHPFPDVIPHEQLVGLPAVEFVIAVKLAVLDLLPVCFRVFGIAIEADFPAEEPADLLSLAPSREAPSLPPKSVPKTRHGLAVTILLRCRASRCSKWTPWESSPATWVK